jgi:hypothetical protein
VGPDSSVSIATRYGLDGQGIESLWGARLSAPVQTVPGVHPASYTIATGSFHGAMRPGRGVDHLPPPRTEVKGRVELYLYFPSGPSLPVLVWTLPYRNTHQNRLRWLLVTSSKTNRVVIFGNLLFSPVLLLGTAVPTPPVIRISKF